MLHRSGRYGIITSLGLALAIATLGAVSGLFFLPRAEGSPPAQKETPHPVEGREDCLLCHDLGRLVPFPQDHGGRSTESCLLCHPPATTEPSATPTPTPTPAPVSPTPTPASTPPPAPPGVPRTPHPIEGREDCLLCHDLGRLVPFPQDHEGRSTESCLLCHAPATTEPLATPTPTPAPPPPPPGVPHTVEGRANCLMCHGETAIQPFPPEHMGRSNELCQVCHQLAQPLGPTAGPAVPPGPFPSLREEQRYCLSCHGDTGLTKTLPDGRRISLYVNVELREDSSHRYIRCTTCHSSEPHKIDTPLTKLSLAAKCGACHQYQYELHLKSIHGQQLVQGNPDVATCVDCHSPDRTPHSVVRVLEYDAPAYKKNIAETCGRCHGDERLMARYGIVEKVYESYMRSFHGKAMRLGTYDIRQLNKATCTSCHGTHDIMDPHDPDSPVAGMENLARACGQCHPGAGVEFASGFLGHEEASPEHAPLAFYAERFFLILTAVVVALGVGVVMMASMRWALRGWREEE